MRVRAREPQSRGIDSVASQSVSQQYSICNSKMIRWCCSVYLEFIWCAIWLHYTARERTQSDRARMEIPHMMDVSFFFEKGLIRLKDSRFSFEILKKIPFKKPSKAITIVNSQSKIDQYISSCSIYIYTLYSANKLLTDTYLVVQVLWSNRRQPKTDGCPEAPFNL